MQSPWPLSVVALSPSACGAVLWRMRGAERLTVVVKATFALVHDRSAELAAAADLVRTDQLREGWGSLEEASETAPYLPGAGVIVRGHACAPAGTTATALPVRLALFRDGRWILNKTLHVFGDRTREAPSPRPFSRMPLVYERAFGGPRLDVNPVGVGSDAALPSIVDPGDPMRPAGFGPIARHWAPRRHLLARDQAADPPALDLDGSFDFRYFHAAPADQQIDLLRGDEWIFLEGLHPHWPWLRSSLPSARGLARLYRAGPEGEDHGQPVELVADTLTIDADRLLCSVLWRGNVALLAGDTPARMRVVAGVEMPGQPLAWPSAAAAPSPPHRRHGALGPVAGERPIARTLVVDDNTVDARDSGLVVDRKMKSPFALAAPGSGRASPVTAIPGAPWSARPHLAPLPPLPVAMASGPTNLDAPPLGVAPLDLTVTAITENTAGPVAPPHAPAAPAAASFATRAAPAVASPTAPAVASLGTPAAPAVASPAATSPAATSPEPEIRGLRATLLARLRSGQPLHDLELAGAELDGIDFSGASLERLNLAGSTLTRCNFASARLSGANMSGTDLTDASLHAADLTRADLSRATLDRAQLSSALLKNADLAFAKGSRARFEDASLEGADLRQARLVEAVFDRACLADINATKADISRASLAGANLAGAVLRAAKLKEASLPCANVEGADLRDADLAGANVYGVKLASAKSSGAILRALVEIPPADAGIDGSSAG
ncbi:DUF2169 family type VI secretion system accessory protein [Sorangium atrum]|uniref:DUF2169 domain-containing protein n=1 Tax=Sorangium atrum TaxID=2995308 RepID=A0ABT5BY26_9BACT|nr:DUF2169 domain-containing protein [Sorangium aterium]MDC0677857.1 DUF2169 domain-containing protein [Sorangium aterium]